MLNKTNFTRKCVEYVQAMWREKAFESFFHNNF